MTSTFSDIQANSQEPTMLEIVMTALKATGRIPAIAPPTGLPPYFHRDNITDFYLEEHSGGWVANIAFSCVPPGLNNTIGTPDALPLPTERDAFLMGAMLVCELVTGSHDLPFFLAGHKLIVFAQG
ncbi:MAG: hypothetical protein KKC72_13420 [Alphaproteobacteria bacterium]|nr:hypothetical protein [Alphaproteobacteria bacterium]